LRIVEIFCRCFLMLIVLRIFCCFLVLIVCRVDVMRCVSVFGLLMFVVVSCSFFGRYGVSLMMCVKSFCMLCVNVFILGVLVSILGSGLNLLRRYGLMLRWCVSLMWLRFWMRMCNVLLGILIILWMRVIVLILYRLF